MAAKTLYDKVVVKFKNTWVGVIILVCVLVYPVIKLYPEVIKSLRSHDIENVNKQLLLLSDSITSKLGKGNMAGDTIATAVKRYVAVRRSIDDKEVLLDVKQKESRVKDLLFMYTRRQVDRWAESKEKGAEPGNKYYLPFLCNELIAYCNYTPSCNDAEIELLKKTIHDIEN